TARQRQQAAFKNASRLLESARRSELEAAKALAEAISSEVAASTIRVQERAVAVYKDALNRKRTAALKKAQSGFVAAWLRKREQVDAKKLARKVKLEAAKAAQARKK